MPTPPPSDDEIIEQASMHYSMQRRNRVAESRQKPTAYSHRQHYSDEHPEIPKVKRASLQASKADKAPATSRAKGPLRDASRPLPSAKGPLVEKNVQRPLASSVRGKQSVQATSAATKKFQRVEPERLRPASHNKMSQARTYAEDPTETVEEEPHKILVTQRYRSHITTVYEPRTSTSSPYRSHVQHTKRRNIPFAYLQNLSHNPSFMLVTSILIVLLILLPIVVKVATNNTHSITTVSASGTTIVLNNGTQAATSASPSDPHALVVTPNDTDHPAPPVFATSAYLLDADTGTTLYAHNPFAHLPMLSTTKLMTAVLAAEKGNLAQKITITPAISNDINQLSPDSSLMGLKKGETYTLSDLLYGMFLMSGNDAAIAVADTISGNLPTFVNLMNQRAGELGLHDTHYMNPHGLLTDGHYSSAHDLAFLGKFVMNIPLLHQISGTKQYTITANAQHPAHVMFNGNQFIWWYPGADGGKPGWDGNANFIQVVSVTRNGHHLIGVTMHTNDWWTDMRNLMNWGFDNFQWISPHDVDLTNPIPYDADWNFFARDTKNVTVPTPDHGRYYVFTGYSISGIILTYVDKNGGIQKFGFPSGLPKTIDATDMSQQFQHATIQCNTTSKQCGAA